MKTKSKTNLTVIALMFMLLTSLILAGCGGRQNELISVTLSPWATHTTKTEYYAGDEFDASETCVAVKYYNKEENTETTLNTPLNKLSQKGFSYTVSGFDSSTAVESQTVTITITSDTYPGSVFVNYNVKILPEYIVASEVIDANTYIKEVYAVGEELPLSQMQIRNLYSNERLETINVIAEMVTGFDTTSVSVNTKTFKITQNGKELKFNYTVAPASGYQLFADHGIKCFLPSSELGYKKGAREIFASGSTYYYTETPSHSSVEIAYSSAFTNSETGIQVFFGLSLNYRPIINILSFNAGVEVNGNKATVCKFQFNQYSSENFRNRIYTAYFFTSAPVGSTVSHAPVMFFRGVDNSVLNNIVNSVKVTV